MKKTKTRQPHARGWWVSLTCVFALALGLVGSANAAEEELFKEDFQTDGEGTRYTVQNGHCSDLQSGDYNCRLTYRDTVEIRYGTLDDSIPEAEQYFWYYKDLNSIGVAVEDLLDDQGRTIWNDPIDITGYGNLAFTFEAAAGRPEQEPDTIMSFEYRIDGGDWISAGGFKGIYQQSPSHFFLTYEVAAEENSKVFPDRYDPQLVGEFRSWVIPIYDTGESMEIRVFGSSGGGREEFGYDDLRVMGDMDVDTMSAATDKAVYEEGTDTSGTLTVTLGAAAPAGGVTVSIRDSDKYNTEADIGSSFTIAEGQTVGTLDFDVLADGRFDGNQTVRVYLDAPGYARTHTTFVVNNVEEMPNIVINEVYSDPGGRHDTELFTEDANNDGMSDRDDDEFVELVNTEDYDVDMSGYVLLHNADGAGVVHRFPEGTIVPAGYPIVVFSGGDPQGIFGGAVVQTSSSRAMNMNDNGEVLSLESGGAVVTSVVLTSEHTDLLTSGVRNPDVTGDFDALANVQGGVDPLFNPGVKNDGSPFFTSSDTLTLSFAEDNVDEGASIQGTVSVTSAAPAGGLTVNLAVEGRKEQHLNMSHFGPAGRDNPAKLTVPAQVTIAEGATSVNFDATGVDSGTLDGDRIMEVRASGTDLFPAIARVTVNDVAVDDFDVVVNEGMANFLNTDTDPNQNGKVDEFVRDHFVEVANAGDSEVNLTGWRLLVWRWTEPSGAQLVHIFDGTILQPNGSVVVWGGSPKDKTEMRAAEAAELQLRSDDDFGGSIQEIANMSDAGINIQIEDGCRIVLQGPYGHIEDDVEWSQAEGEALGARTRDPDITGPFGALHPDVSLALLAQSPGTDYDGTPFSGNGISSAQVLGGGANPLDAEDWFWSDWLGAFNTTFDPWVFHAAHGFIYRDPGSPTGGSLFFYDPPMSAWWWTTEGTYPYLYIFDPAADNNGLDVATTWVWYFDDDVDPRIFATIPGGEFLSFDMSL